MSHIIVLFGQSGAGKTFVGKILRETYGYHLYNADRSLPRVMRRALFQKEIITDDMRDAFFLNVQKRVRQLTKKYQKITLVQTFIKEKYRKYFLQQFPNTKFILITANITNRESRYMKRGYFNLGLSYLRQMSKLFEKPAIPHTAIVNDEDGKSQIRKQLSQLPFLSPME